MHSEQKTAFEKPYEFYKQTLGGLKEGFLKNAEVKITSGRSDLLGQLGHLLNIDNPGLTHTILKAFINRLGV